MTAYRVDNHYGRAIVGVLMAAGVSAALAGIGWSINKISNEKRGGGDEDPTHGSNDVHDDDVQNDSEYDYWVTMWDEIRKRLLDGNITTADIHDPRELKLAYTLLYTYSKIGHENNLEWLILHEDKIVRFLNDVKPGSISFDPKHKLVIRKITMGR